MTRSAEMQHIVAFVQESSSRTVIVNAIRLTPPGKLGITFGIFQPTRPSPSPRHFPWLLWQHPLQTPPKNCSKNPKNKFRTIAPQLRNTDRKHAIVYTTERVIFARKDEHVTFGAQFRPITEVKKTFSFLRPIRSKRRQVDVISFLSNS